MIKKIYQFVRASGYFLIIGMVAILISTAFVGLKEINKAEAEEVISDVNGDGTINLRDARTLSPPDSTSCKVCVDVNGDKVINQTDVDIVQGFINMKTNVMEQVQVQTSDQDGSVNPIYKTRYDVNNDQIVDNNDVSIIQNYLNQQVTGSSFGLDKPSELTFGYKAKNLIIRFKPEISDVQKQELYAKYNLVPKFTITKSNAVLVETPNDNIEDLQNSVALESMVQYAGKNHILELMTDDPRWGDQWGHTKIRIEETWYTETNGRENPKVKVGIIDSGVDLDADLNYDHYDLGQNLSQTKRYNAEQDSGLPFYAQDVHDEIGHGTHMAGIIGATANNNLGIAGLNWNVEIIPIKACLVTATLAAECPEFLLSQALNWAESQDLDILNMSLGNGNYQANDDYGNSSYIDNMVELGVIVIAAAGNEGRNDCDWPAAHAGVICVGSTAQNDTIAVNSSGIQDADVFAPGVAILSTVPADSIFDGNGNGLESLNINNQYGGTSMAAAYVSGVTALCISVSPMDIPSSRPQLKCNNNYQHNGYGRIDAWGTVWYHNCFKVDVTNDNKVDGLDRQGIAFRMNAPSRYSPTYDIFPVGGDGVINGSDLFVVNAWHGIDCLGEN